MTRSHLLVFGYGYSARRIGAAVLAGGGRVSGTRRAPEKASSLAASGITVVPFDGTRPSPSIGEALASATHVLVSIPPDVDGDPVLAHHANDLKAAASLRWIGYLSTTGVYGDRQGRWVDEEDEPAPTSERSERRVLAERGWRALAGALDVPLQIFRLSGIYGPGRSALDRLREGRARRLVGHGSVFNRVHVDDIAGAVVGGMGSGARGVFNVSDDLPAPPEDVVAYAADLLGVASPPEVTIDDADLSPAARSFYAESKRVGNARLLSGLGYALRYPTYREGLASIARGGRTRTNGSP